MKRLSIYDVLRSLSNGGYIAEKITAVHERRSYSVYKPLLPAPAECIGYITVGDFERLLETGIVDVECRPSSRDKYGSLYNYYILITQLREQDKYTT